MDRKWEKDRKTVHKRQRMIGVKTTVCFIGLFILVFIAFTYRNQKINQEKAPYVTLNEILPVLEALSIVNENSAYKQITDRNIAFTQEFVTVGDIKWLSQFYPKADTLLPEEYKKDSWYLGREDWKQVLLKLVQQYGAGEIVEVELALYGDTCNIMGESLSPIPDNCVYTSGGILENDYIDIQQYLFSNTLAICYEKRILYIAGYSEKTAVLRNVYLSEVTDEQAHFFTDHYHIYYENGSGKKEDRKAEILDWKVKEPAGKMIVDLQFDRGVVSVMEKDVEFVHGKLLQVSDVGIEVEGYGIFEPDDEMKIYRLYGELESQNQKDLRIGYSFTDFVLENGKIVACLIIKEENMEYIRVLLKNSDYMGRYHSSFSAKCNQDYEIIYYRNGMEEKREEKKSDEAFQIKVQDMEAGIERIKLVSKVLSAKMTIDSISRSQGTPSYNGMVEISAEEDGLLVINEVLLEDYLCKVVPSEMPSSYPREALMAQAVCARTYAYGKMLKAGLPDFGAHVDDSVGFQVYNNIMEQSTATDAVKATHNIIVEYEGVPIGAYYYSTSCGVGSDADVWHGSGENPAYLMSKIIAAEKNYSGTEQEKTVSDNSVSNNSVKDNCKPKNISAEALEKEEMFRQWIESTDASHYESGEGWYRWMYTVENPDVEHMEDVLSKRYESNPQLVLTLNEAGEFESQPICELGTIQDLQITKRLAGGVADELVITGSKSTVKVLSELNIRYVLSDGVTKVVRQSGDEVSASNTLPSAFIILDLEKEDEKVVGYRVTGGGYGHGVGMSQNGARNMAQAGKNYEEILTFFYPGAKVKSLQNEEK